MKPETMELLKRLHEKGRDFLILKYSNEICDGLSHGPAYTFAQMHVEIGIGLILVGEGMLDALGLTGDAITQVVKGMYDRGGDFPRKYGAAYGRSARAKAVADGMDKYGPEEDGKNLLSLRDQCRDLLNRLAKDITEGAQEVAQATEL